MVNVRFDAGDDLDAFEGMMGQFATGTQARDMRMMFRAFHKYGMAPKPVTHSILAGVLGGSSRRYTDFAREGAGMTEIPSNRPVAVVAGAGPGNGSRSAHFWNPGNHGIGLRVFLLTQPGKAETLALHCPRAGQVRHLNQRVSK